MNRVTAILAKVNFVKRKKYASLREFRLLPKSESRE